MDKLSQPGPAAGGGSRAATPGKPSGSTSPSTKDNSLGSTKFGTASPSLVPGKREDAGLSSTELTSATGSAAAALSAGAKDAAKTAGRAVQEQASQFAADVGHELKKTAEDQKMRGAEAIQCFARAIESAAGELEKQSPRLARSARDAAQKVEGLSHNITNRNVDELMNAATDLARSQPVLFIGGAIAAGFAFSRFLKSSASNHASTSRTSSQGGPDGMAQG
jgi:histone H3/H4